ncbi:MAG: hypothetical protein AAGG07_11765 [Planctomycetota bacterium]
MVVHEARCWCALVVLAFAGDLLAAPNERLGPDDPRRAPVERYEELFGSVLLDNPRDAALQPFVDLWRWAELSDEERPELDPALLKRVAAVPLGSIRAAEIRIDNESVYAGQGRVVVSGAMAGAPLRFNATVPRAVLETWEDLEHAERLQLCINIGILGAKTYEQASKFPVPELDDELAATRNLLDRALTELTTFAYSMRSLVIQHLLQPELTAHAERYVDAIGRVEAEVGHFRSDLSRLMRRQDGEPRGPSELPSMEFLIWGENAPD